MLALRARRSASSVSNFLAADEDLSGEIVISSYCTWKLQELSDSRSARSDEDLILEDFFFGVEGLSGDDESLSLPLWPFCEALCGEGTTVAIRFSGVPTH